MDRQSERDTERQWKNWEKERDKELKRERFVFQEAMFKEACRRRWVLSSRQRQTERVGGGERERAGQSFNAATQAAKGQTISMSGTTAVWSYNGWATEKILTTHCTPLRWLQTAQQFMLEKTSRMCRYWEKKPHLGWYVFAWEAVTSITYTGASC